MAELATFKYAPEEVRNFFAKVQGLPEYAQRDLYQSNFPSSTNSDIDKLVKVFVDARKEESDPARRKQILEDQVAFQGELMKQAAPYKLLFDIPQTISQAFGNQAAMNVLGARSITDAYNTALQAYPRTQFTTTPYTPRNYFN